MKAVILDYEKKMLMPLFQMLAGDEPFRKILDDIMIFVTSDSDERQIPSGCLFVCMRESYNQMGEATKEQLDQISGRIRAVYEEWVERSKAKGEFSADMSSKFAATYIYSQMSYASSKMARGGDKKTVRAVLKTALSML